MSEKQDGSTDELSMYFRENSGPIDDAVAGERDTDLDQDTSEDAPDEIPDKKRKEEPEDDDLDEDDSDDDLEDDDSDDDEDDADSSKETQKLRKDKENLENYRRQLQSENDTLKSSLKKLEQKIDLLFDSNNKKAEQSEIDAYFTGEDDALMTEGQVKKIVAAATKRRPEHQQRRPEVGTDAEAQSFWADTQPDAKDVMSYYNENKAQLDVELAPIPSIDGRFLAVRHKKTAEELRSAKKALKKLKSRIKRMEKGELPETASGKRAGPKRYQRQEFGNDPIDNFFR